MTNEDPAPDVPISNWTLATRTKPGARDVCSTTRDEAHPSAPLDTHVVGSLQRVMHAGDDTSNQVVERAA